MLQQARAKPLDSIGLTAALVAAAAWASTGIFVRFLDAFSTIVIVSGRSLVALVAATLLLTIRRQNVRLFTAVHSPLTWVLAALMIAYYLFAVAAFQLAPVSEVALLISTSPLFALSYSAFQGLPMPSHEKLGSLMAVGGVIIIFGPEIALSSSDQEGRLLGDTLALSGSAVMTFYSLLYRSAGAKCTPSPRAVTFLTFFLGALGLFSWLALWGTFPSIELFLDPGVLLLFAGLGFISTLLPTVCYSLASKRLSSVAVTSTRLFTPVLAAILAMMFLREFPLLWFWIGAPLVLGGLWIISR